MASSNKFQFAIDRGGTFTDVFARCPDGKIRVLKLLSEDPQHYKDAPTEGIRRILEQVWKCLYKPKEKFRKDEFDQKHVIVQKLVFKHIQHRNTLHALKKFDNSLTDSKITEKFIRSLPQREEMKIAPRKWIAGDLKPFVIKPVQEQVEEKQPLEYLTEMREVTIQFINIVPTTFQEQKLVVLMDTAFQIICSIVTRLLGVVNKVSLFDKDAMILVLFGLRGIKHELESQNALKSGFKIRRALSKLENVESVSVGITNGLVYCGVVGHPLRREYSVIGGTVNKAARIMCAYEHKVTCDHNTYINSKLSSCYFQLQSALKLKGIEDAGRIFEYNEDFEDLIEYEKQWTPIIGRQLELDLIDLIINRTEEAEGYRALCLHGRMKTGKSRILRAALTKCSNQGHNVASIALCGSSQRPYFCVSNLYRQLYDAKTKLKSDTGIIKDLPRDLWNLNEILQSSSAINRKKKILSMFQEMLNGSKTNITVIFIDNIQYIDMQSFHIIESSFMKENLRMISAGQFEEDTWDTQWKLSLSEYVKLLELESLNSKYTPVLICQFLSVKGAPKKLINLIDKSCEGRPGWVQSCLLRLVNNGGIEIKYINKDDLVWKKYVFPDTIHLTSPNKVDKEKEDLFLKDKEVVAVAELAGKIQDTENLTLAAISMDLFDSFTPYQQLVIKTGAVLGEIFTRSLIIVMLKYPSEQLFASAVKHLFEENVFDCGTKYINSNGIMSKELSCLCFMDEVDFEIHDSCLPLKLPKYAFCKVLHFKNKSLKFVAYELLPANQRKEIHLRTTDVLENQNNNCPSCLRDNSAAIIMLSTFRKILKYCFDPKKPYTVQERMEVGYGSNLTDLKDVIRRNMKKKVNSETSVNCETSVGRAVKTIPKRKVWDPSTCFCLEILTRVYADLIHHSECAGHLGKRIFFLMQYGVILIIMQEFSSALPHLMEASELCMMDASNPNSIISESFRRLHIGKIQMLLSEANFRLGNLEIAKNHLVISLRQYNAPMLSLKYCLQNKLLNRSFITKMKNVLLTNYHPRNSMLRSDFGLCMNLLSNIFAAEGYWELAKLSSARSISMLRDTNTNVGILCDVYSNAIDYYSFCGDGHTCEKLERCIAKEILRIYTGNVVIELFALSKLINIIFQTRVMDGRISDSIHVGFRAMYLNNTVQAHFIQNETIPVLASVLLLKQRVQEAVEVMRLLYNIGKVYDEIALLSYYSFCIELYIETNFMLEDVDKCELFAKRYFSREDSSNILTDKEFKLVVYLYSYFLRKSRWTSALQWKNLLKLENINKRPTYISVSNLMKYTECSIIMLVRSMEMKKTFIHLEEQRTEAHLRECEVVVKKWRIFLPRYYHYKAYFYRIKRNKSKVTQYCKLAIQMARKQENVLEQCWIKLNQNVWAGGFSFKNEMKNIDWKLAKTYSSLQWTQILYALPQYT